MNAVIVIKTANGFIVSPYQPNREGDMSQARVATSINSHFTNGPTVTEVLIDLFTPPAPEAT
jgi:hypothetical protein